MICSHCKRGRHIDCMSLNCQCCNKIPYEKKVRSRRIKKRKREVFGLNSKDIAKMTKNLDRMGIKRSKFTVTSWGNA